MSLAPLPLIVISGYLGAGKTTLINRLLRDADGRRIMVLVNDFGAINIDADLLQSADEDTLTLTNGCVCCTMGADLFMALGDALDRRPRPDILVIEASGIAHPGNIAQAAKAEPDLRYGGIVSLVDAQNFLASENDPLISAQVREQIVVADLLVLAKSGGNDQPVLARLAQLTKAPVLWADDAGLSDLVLDSPKPAQPAQHPHTAYASWSHQGTDRWAQEQLTKRLKNPPAGVFRIKGRVLAPDHGGWEIHLVGNTLDIRKIETPSETYIVAIGPKSVFDRQTAADWWARD